MTDRFNRPFADAADGAGLLGQSGSGDVGLIGTGPFVPTLAVQSTTPIPPAVPFSFASFTGAPLRIAVGNGLIARDDEFVVSEDGGVPRGQGVAADLSFGADFSENYSAFDLGSIDGLPPVYGGFTFLDGSTTTILIGGDANNEAGLFYTVDVIRDDAGHIVGFEDNLAPFGTIGEFNDGGVAFGPGGVLFTAQWEENMLGLTAPGDTDETKVIDLDEFGVDVSVAGLGFVPDGFDGAGSFKITSYNTGAWYDVVIADDGESTFDIVSVTQVDLDPEAEGIQNLAVNGFSVGPEGFVYIEAGSFGFDVDTMLVAEFNNNLIAAYDLDGGGNPLVSTRRTFLDGLEGAEGALIDPVTGDFLFSTYGGGDRIVRIEGFGSTNFVANLTDDNGNGPDEVPLGSVATVTQLDGVAFTNGAQLQLLRGGTVTVLDDGTIQIVPGEGYQSLGRNDQAIETFTYTLSAPTEELAPGVFNAVVNAATLSSDEGVLIGGAQAGDYSGISVAGVGDVNQDGFDDFLIGAYLDGAENRGAATLVYGSSDLPTTLAEIANGQGTVFRGDNPQDMAGFDVAAAGDVDGDGIDDYLISAYRADLPGARNVGLTVLVYGQAEGTAPGPFSLGDLTTAEGFGVFGASQNDYSGFTLAGAGDLNADGLDDFVVGAWPADPNGRFEAGEVYVVYGQEGKTRGGINLAEFSPQDGFTISGGAQDDRFGYSIDLGDLNNDGIDDLIVGALNVDNGADVNAGAAYVFFGQEGGFSGDLNVSDADLTYFGANAGDSFGRSVAVLGDVNGDGLADVAIGANNAGAEPAAGSGAVHILFGGSGLSAGGAVDQLGSGAGFTFRSTEAEAQAGISVSDAGDVNADGINDILIGVPLEGSANVGAAYVVFGGEGLTGTITAASLDGTNGFQIIGGQGSGNFGFSVDAAGDVNGDGVDDLIIGGFGANNAAGQTAIIFGRGTAGGVAESTATVTVTIQGVNDAPTNQSPNAFTVTEGESVVGTLLASDIDVGDTLTFSIVGGADAELFSISGNQLLIDSALDVTSDQVFDVVVGVSDGLLSDDQAIAVTVLNDNEAPTAINDLLVFNEGDNPVVNFDLTANDLDPDGDNLVAVSFDGDATPRTITTGLGTVIIFGEDGLLSVDPTASFGQLPPDGEASISFAYEVSDGQGGVDQGTVTIQLFEAPENIAPVITGPETVTVAEGEVSVATYFVTDEDNGPEPLSFEVIGGADAALFDVFEGDLFFIEAPDVVVDETFNVTLQTSDGEDTAEIDVAVTVIADNDPPVVTGETFSITEDETNLSSGSSVPVGGGDGPGAMDLLPIDGDQSGESIGLSDIVRVAVLDMGGAINLLDNDFDPNGDDLFISSVNGVAVEGSIALELANGTAFVSADGSFDYTPNAGAQALGRDETVTDTVTYVVGDGESSASATASVTVFGLNDAPVNQSPVSFTIAEGASVVGTLSAFDIDANDTLTFSITGGVDGELFSIEGNTLVIDPEVDVADDQVFDVAVSVSDGLLSDEKSIAVTVTAVNDTPEVTGEGFFIDEDAESLSSQTSSFVNLLDNDFDPNGDNIFIAEAGGVPVGSLTTIQLTLGEVQISSDGSFDFFPNAAAQALSEGDVEVETITYTVSDGELTAEASVAVTILGVNDAPFFTSAASFTVDNGSEVVGSITADDVDTGAELTFSLDEGGDAELFTVNPATGLLSFIEPPAVANTTVFNVTALVTDGLATVEQNIAIEVVQNNVAPDASDDFFEMSEDDAFLSVALSGLADVLVNDSDFNNDVLFLSSANGQPFTGSLSFALSGGQVDISDDGQFEFTPNADYNFLADGESVVSSFDYVVTDGALTATATATVTIRGENDPVDAIDDEFVFTAEQTTFSRSLVVNDLDADSTDVLSIVSFGLPFNPSTFDAGQTIQTQNGTLTVNASGSFVFVHDGSIEEGDGQAFTYTLTDGITTDTATVTLVSAGAANQPPVAEDDEFFVSEDDPSLANASSGFANILDNDFDPDEDSIALQSVDGQMAGGGIVTVDLTFGTATVDTVTGALDYTTNALAQTLAAGESVVDTFDYVITDGQATATGTVTFNVFGADDPGQAVAVDPIFITQNEGLSIDLRSLIDDPEGSANYVVFDAILSLADPQARMADFRPFDPEYGFGDRAFEITSDGRLILDADSDFDALPAGVDQQVLIDLFLVDRADFSGATEIALSDLGNQQVTRFIGDQAGDILTNGTQPAAFGDFNGDGIDDLLLASQNASANGNYGGVGYIVFGRPESDLGATFDLSNAGPEDGALLIGTDNDLGLSISVAGDFFGTGLDQVVISRPGQVFVTIHSDDGGPRYGGDTFYVGSYSFDAVGFYSSYGDESFGYAVAGRGDFNGDGLDDIIIGSPTEYDGAGRAYIVFGIEDLFFGESFSGSIDLADDNGPGVRVIEGAVEQSYGIGRDVDFAGDFNGDGFDDVIIGGRGVAAVVFGGEGAAADRSIGSVTSLNGADGFQIAASSTGSYVGRTVASAGDINNDGFDDILIGDPGGERAFVVFGQSAPITNDLDLDAPGGATVLEIFDTTVPLGFGFSVSGAGDVNGDGTEDFIVSSYSSDYVGAAYVIFGDPAGFSGALDLSDLAPGQGVKIVGDDVQSATGFTVAAAGDLNNDGFSDILIGEPGGDLNGETAQGIGSVVYGRALFGEPTAAPVQVTLDVTVSGLDDSFTARNDFYSVDVGNDIVFIPTLNDADPEGDALFTRVMENVPGLEQDDRNEFFYSTFGQFDELGENESVLITFDYDVTDDIYLELTSTDVDGVFTNVLLPSSGKDFGASSAGSDLDGDGVADIAIGAPDRSGGGTGEVAVTYIDAGGALGQSFTITHGDAALNIGGSLVGGDFNGDGVGDLAIGVLPTVVGAGATETGGVYVLFGQDGQRFAGEVDLATLTASDGYFISGGAVGGTFGLTIANAGDVDGDEAGADDLIIGDANDLGTDKAYVVYGRSSGDINTSTDLDGTNGFEITHSAEQNTDLGFAVAGLGDLNGDGFEDVGVTATSYERFTEGSESYIGAGYVIFGQSSRNQAASVSVSDLDGTNGAAFFGALGDEVGQSIAGADFSGDGLPDVLLGSTKDSGPFPISALRILGYENTGSGFSSVNVLDPFNSFYSGGAVASPLVGDGLGTLLGAIGDVNGDGIKDFFASAPNSNDNDQGGLFILFSDTEDDGNYNGYSSGYSNYGYNDVEPINEADSAIVLEITKDEAFAQIGRSVSALGDVNGDGFDDFLVTGGAAFNPLEASASAGQGSAFIVFGASQEPELTLGNLQTATVTIEVNGVDRVVARNDDFTTDAGQVVTGALFTNDEGSEERGQQPLLVGVNGLSDTAPTTVTLRSGSVVEINADGTFTYTPSSAFDFLLEGETILDSFSYNLDDGFGSFARNPAFIDSSSTFYSRTFSGTAYSYSGESGAYASPEVGRTVSGIGDVNGDGFDDFAVSAPNYDTGGYNYNGATFVLFGSISTYNTNAPLTTSRFDGYNGFTILGGTADAEVGRSITAVGDVNGDGIDDFALTSDTQSGEYAGPKAVHIVFGQNVYGGTGAFASTLNLDELDGTNGFTLTHGNSSTEFGSAITGDIDLNGDGIDDFVIGAANDAGSAAEDGSVGAGRTYVVFGGGNFAASAQIGTLVSSGDAAELSESASGAAFGSAVSGSDDINGDGVDDLLISSRETNQAHIVFGNEAMTGGQVSLDVSNSATIIDSNIGVQTQNFTGFGEDIEGIGDFNGDGFGDFALSQPDEISPFGFGGGVTHILYGGASIVAGATVDLASSPSGFTVVGEAPGQGLGAVISAVGDVNGDGIDDVLINSSPSEGATETISYLLYGGSDFAGIDISGFSLNGENGAVIVTPGGQSVGVGVGNATFDDRADLLFGNPTATDFGTSDVGEVYFLRGSFDMEPSHLTAEVRIEVNGTQILVEAVAPSDSPTFVAIDEPAFTDPTPLGSDEAPEEDIEVVAIDSVGPDVVFHSNGRDEFLIDDSFFDRRAFSFFARSDAYLNRTTEPTEVAANEIVFGGGQTDSAGNITFSDDADVTIVEDLSDAEEFATISDPVVDTMVTVLSTEPDGEAAFEPTEPVDDFVPLVPAIYRADAYAELSNFDFGEIELRIERMWADIEFDSLF